MKSKRLERIREELEEMAERESLKWFRIARRAIKKGCSEKLIEEIRNEAFWLHNTATTYPDRLIEPDFEYKHKFIFQI